MGRRRHGLVGVLVDVGLRLSRATLVSLRAQPTRFSLPVRLA